MPRCQHVILACGLLFSACTGRIADRPRVDDPGCVKPTPGPSPMRRLTRFEYSNTVRDLLGDNARPGNTFPVEEIGNGFGNDANALTVSFALAEKYFDAAEGIADRLVADRDRFAAHLGCDPAVSGEEPCSRAFIERFGARAYRRPLTEEDRQVLFGVYSAVRAQPDQSFDAAIGAVVQTVLQSPDFLYRVEVGAPIGDGIAQVDHWEIASRLSYQLWGSMPDDELFAEAAAGRLGTAAEVRAEAARMLEDSRAKDVVRHFFGTLLLLQGVESVTRDQVAFPEFTAEIPALLKEESNQFIDHVVWEGSGDLKTLLTAPFSYMNARLAAYYGVEGRPGAPTAEAFERIELDPSRAAGVLTQGGLMTTLTPSNSTTNPVLRGKFVLSRLLCTSLPAPQGFVPTPPPYDPTLTTRERFAAHSNNEACVGCHSKLDPLGFAFEHYDQTGRWRDVDNGKPIDASGTVVGTDVDGPIVDAIELGEKLAESRQVESCIVGHWLRFAYGRTEVAADACTRTELERVFEESGGSLRALMLELTQTDAFLYREEKLP